MNAACEGRSWLLAAGSWQRHDLIGSAKKRVKREPWLQRWDLAVLHIDDPSGCQQCHGHQPACPCQQCQDRTALDASALAMRRLVVLLWSLEAFKQGWVLPAERSDDTVAVGISAGHGPTILGSRLSIGRRLPPDRCFLYSRRTQTRHHHIRTRCEPGCRDIGAAFSMLSVSKRLLEHIKVTVLLGIFCTPIRQPWRSPDEMRLVMNRQDSHDSKA